MTAILENESRRRLRGSVVLIGVFAALAILYFSIFPEFSEGAVELEAAISDSVFEAFGTESYHTIEGFIAAEMYSFFWVLLIAVYFAYVSAGIIAGDIESRKMDLTLSTPVSRESVVAQKMAALWVPLVALNFAVPFIVYVVSVSIDEPINPVALAMVHLLSVPYLLVCAAIGLVVSVLFDRARTAQGIALVAVFMLWLVDTISTLDPEYEWLGQFTPSRYYDETEILVNEVYAFFDAAILLVAFVLLVLVATGIFVERDI
ncbi:MAG: ABC transporter permease [Halobacteriota archaeon]